MSFIRKIFVHIVSTIHLVYFVLLLLIFDPLQRIAYYGFGVKAHRFVGDIWLRLIITGWYITGSTAKFRQAVELPQDRPIIFIANHQGMFDMPMISWKLRRHNPIYVSKISLSKRIPSISFYLRATKAALIDRNDGRQAIQEVARLGTYLKETGFSTVIFPEGTRSPKGELRAFAVGGVAILLKKAPNALVVPIAIENSGKFNPRQLYPIRPFTPMSWTVLNPIEPKGIPVEDLVAQAHEQIRISMKQ